MEGLNEQVDSNENYLLVVGGTGFIGTWVVRSAVDRGYRVRVLSRSTPHPNQAVEGAEYLRVDISKFKDVFHNIDSEPITHVINLGGNIDHAEYKVGGRDIVNSHLVGLFNLVECLDWGMLKQFVQIGSSDEYGDASPPQHEDETCNPISSYSYSKFGATEFLKMLHRTEKFPATILRLFLVYGPGQNRDRFLPQIISACLGDRVFATSKGEQFRDFTYIDDIVEGIFLALESGGNYGEVINLASGNPIRIRSMVERVVKLVGRGHPEFGTIQYRTGENMKLYADVEKARCLLSWLAVVDIEEGLRRTIAYYLNGS